MTTRPIAEPSTSASEARACEVALEVGGVAAHPDDHPGDHPDRDQGDDRLELLLLPLGQVLLGDVQRPRRPRRRAAPRPATPSHIHRSASRRPCWRRNAATIPTISAASRPSRRPMTKVGSTSRKVRDPLARDASQPSLQAAAEPSCS